MRRRAGGLVKAASPLLLGFAIMSDCANAAEGGASFYWLGSRSPLGGAHTPPGVYYQNDFYHYSGHAGAGIHLELGGQFVAKVDGRQLGFPDSRPPAFGAWQVTCWEETMSRRCNIQSTRAENQ
ncbi:hypothetical protein RCCGEPOP_30324 [Rhizobium sp. Pop5]|nr:hypothetical protein RCCGEPOP_30324 [Rhizobium sp. Pop5]